jgi:hypothetical protein
MKLPMQPKIGIEIEFAMDIELLKTKLDANNIKYEFMENPRLLPLDQQEEYTGAVADRRRAARIRRSAALDTLVVKPDKSVGELDGWELNFPPTYTWEQIEEVLELLRECNPTFPANAALHVHVDTYFLSTYNIDQIHKYYYENQKNIIAEAEAVNLYVDLNEPLPEKLSDVVVRKVNLNIRRALKRHNTIEHRIYKSTLNIDEVKWCVNHTLNTIEKAIV